MQKALKTANSEKCVFSCQASNVLPGPPNSLVFRRKPCSEFRFLPRQACEFQPLSLSPLVTASSPLAFWVQKCAKAAPVPDLVLRRVFRGPTARRGPGSEPDSLPRFSHVTRSPPMSPVSNTSACRGTRVESSLPRLAPETNAYTISPSAFVTVPKRPFLAPKNACLTSMSPLRHRSLWGRKVRKSAPVPKKTWFLASLSQ